jgi:hypothetical protein
VSGTSRVSVALPPATTGRQIWLSSSRGDHRAREAQAGGEFQLLDPALDVVHVDHRDALEPGGIDAAEFGEPVIVRAKDGDH